MKKYNGEKYIVSFTSFGKRFDSACLMITSLLIQSYKDFHIVMSLYKDDINDITPQLKKFIEDGYLEVILCDRNLCPHLKYLPTMIKYWDKPIITVDDDRIYSNNLIEKLVTKYESLDYKSVISCCAPKMIAVNGVLTIRSYWCTPWQRLKPNEKSYVAMAEGFAGVLYPPKAFENLESELPGVMNSLYDDDIFLKVLGIKNKLPVTQIDGVLGEDVYSIDIPEAQEFNLEKHNNAPMDYRNETTGKFREELLKGFDLENQY